MGIQGTLQIAAPRTMALGGAEPRQGRRGRRSRAASSSPTGSPEAGLSRPVVKQKVGPASAPTFQGKVTLADVVPLTSYTISGEGKGGAAGFAKGGAAVEPRRRGRRHAPHLRGHGQRRRQAGAARLAADRRLRQEDGRQLLRQLPGRGRAAAGGRDAARADGAEDGEKKPGWFRRMIGREA